jgi:hypothetical protein
MDLDAGTNNRTKQIEGFFQFFPRKPVERFEQER